MSEDNKAVYRLNTTSYKTKRGFITSKKLYKMKRLSSGFDPLMETCENLGIDEAFNEILNLEDSRDGLYIVDAVNIEKDWETGHVEACNLELFPFEEVKSNE